MFFVRSRVVIWGGNESDESHFKVRPHATLISVCSDGSNYNSKKNLFCVWRFSSIHYTTLLYLYVLAKTH